MSPSSGGIYELTPSDPLVAPAPGSTPFTPDQIHVTLGGRFSSHDPACQHGEVAQDLYLTSVPSFRLYAFHLKAMYHESSMSLIYGL